MKKQGWTANKSFSFKVWYTSRQRRAYFSLRAFCSSRRDFLGFFYYRPNVGCPNRYVRKNITKKITKKNTFPHLHLWADTHRLLSPPISGQKDKNMQFATKNTKQFVFEVIWMILFHSASGWQIDTCGHIVNCLQRDRVCVCVKGISIELISHSQTENTQTHARWCLSSLKNSRTRVNPQRYLPHFQSWPRMKH